MEFFKFGIEPPAFPHGIEPLAFLHGIGLVANDCAFPHGGR